MDKYIDSLWDFAYLKQLVKFSLKMFLVLCKFFQFRSFVVNIDVEVVIVTRSNVCLRERMKRKRKWNWMMKSIKIFINIDKTKLNWIRKLTKKIKMHKFICTIIIKKKSTVMNFQNKQNQARLNFLPYLGTD